MNVLMQLRWASITYGRPLGINDKDCNISMPGDVFERWQFKTPLNPNEDPICYSTYQRELNKLYIASSPLLKTIFGIRSYADVEGQIPSGHFSRIMENVSTQLTHWRECLPPHLVFDFDHDILPDASAMQKAFHLQALSLQLTFDHLVIILHRPSLVQQISNLSGLSGPSNGEDSPLPGSSSAMMQFDSPATTFSASSPHAQLPSSEEWWSAALRTSRVTQLPQIVSLAIDGHLIAFLTINLFNAAIVMVVCALSNPLSDRAQDAKRQITRVWRLQEFISRRSKLSMQSCDVLKEGVWMVVRREGEAMLATVQPTALAVTEAGNGRPEVWQQEQESDDVRVSGYGNDASRDQRGMERQRFAYPLSVENTLRLPVDLPSEHLRDPQFLNAWQQNPGFIQEVDETVRLNESLISLQRGKLNATISSKLLFFPYLSSYFFSYPTSIALPLL